MSRYADVIQSAEFQRLPIAEQRQRLAAMRVEARASGNTPAPPVHVPAVSPAPVPVDVSAEVARITDSPMPAREKRAALAALRARVSRVAV